MGQILKAGQSQLVTLIIFIQTPDVLGFQAGIDIILPQKKNVKVVIILICTILLPALIALITNSQRLGCDQ